MGSSILGRDKYLRRKELKQEQADKVLAENTAKAEESIAQINITNTNIFVLAQCLVDHIDRLEDEDHNFSKLSLGKNNYLVRHELKLRCNKFLQELTKTIDNDKQIFTEQYLEDLNFVIAVFQKISSGFGVQNINRMHAIAQVMQEDKPDALIKYYKELGNENRF